MPESAICGNNALFSVTCHDNSGERGPGVAQRLSCVGDWLAERGGVPQKAKGQQPQGPALSHPAQWLAWGLKRPHTPQI